MNGLKAILDHRSKLRWELRSAGLPLAVFTGVVVVAAYCWHDLIPVVKIPGVASVAPIVSYEGTNPALLSASHSCPASNASPLHPSDTKTTVTH
jgi:hypothetical protein